MKDSVNSWDMPCQVLDMVRAQMDKIFCQNGCHGRRSWLFRRPGILTTALAR
jgi:hypothetical protein